MEAEAKSAKYAGRLETQGGVASSGDFCLFSLKIFNSLNEANHIMEGYLLYSKSTDLNVKPIQ